MTTTTPAVGAHRRRMAKAVHCKAMEGQPPGTFETIVSVFGNVDYHGDRIVVGAFEAGNLPEWRESGDPIPVIFTHRWDDLLAHIGVANPSEVRELAPGDSTLPDRLKANGGLYAVQRLDVNADPAASYAARIAELLERRSLREFSFAYDPLGVRPVDGVDELTRLALWEMGPTLLGANPLTELLAAKAKEVGFTPEAIDAVLTDLLGRSTLIDAKAITTTDDGDPAGADDPQEVPTVGDTTEVKAITVTPGGSIEERLGVIFDSAQAWASIEYGGDLFALHLEGTYLDDGYAIVVAERWDDPWGEGPVWRLSFDTDDRGAVTITDAEEVTFEGDFVARRSEVTDAGAKAIAAAKAKAGAPSTDDGLDPATLADVKASGKASPQGEAEDHGAEDDDNLSPADVGELIDGLDLEGIDP